MENITIGQIALGLTFIVGLISSITYLHTKIKVWIADALSDQFEELNGKIDAVDMNATKNFLVARLSDIEQDNPMNEIEAEIKPNEDLVSRLKKKFAEVEKRDEPTIQCLMALSTNEAYLSLGIPQRYQLSKFERYIGIYCSCVKYDNHAKLVDVQETAR